MKAYVCNRWPGLRVQNCQFEEGLFVAKDAKEEALIEGLDYYGLHVIDRDTPEEVAMQRQADAEEKLKEKKAKKKEK